jgi:hypothetical protein
MSEQIQAVPPELRDRSVGLVLFGILQIALGTLSACMVPFMLLAFAVGQAGATPADPRVTLPAIVPYALVAVAGIWLGIGSIRARRWAWALTLVLAWIWLVCGAVGLLYLFLFLRGMFEQMGQAQNMPPGAVLFLHVFTGGMMGCIYVLLPGGVILFYQSRHVRATCERKDPQVRWTDKCPLPVLAVSLLLGIGALYSLMPLAYRGVCPWFGTLLEGAAGALLVLVNAVLFACLSWGTYKLRVWAWIGSIALVAFWGASSLLTFSRVGSQELYERMGYSEEQLALMQQFGAMDQMQMAWMVGISVGIYLAYLLYVGRYFFGPSRRVDRIADLAE